MTARNPWRERLAMVAAGLGMLLTPAAAAENPELEIKALRAQIEVLDRRLRQLEDRQRLKEQEEAAAARTAPKFSVTDRGFTLASADGTNSFSLRGLVQLDARLFFADRGASTNSFVLRRARLNAEGTFARAWSFQFVTEFGGTGAPGILDANLGLALSPAFQLKAGKFKSPVGLELLQSDSWTFFNERSLATDLVPNRDVGLLATGSVLGGAVSFSTGVLNGVPDGATSGNADFKSDKNVVGRIYVSPFKRRAGSPWRGLSLGLAGDAGRQKTASGRTAGYKTDGQQTFFSYAPAVVADGPSWHLSPQGEFRSGPFGMMGEYVCSAVQLRPSPTGARVELRQRAWQVAAGWVLTGEDSSYNGVRPRVNFDPAAGTWGAFELVGRVARLSIDDAAFPLFASPATSAGRATAFGLGANWYLSAVAMVKFDYYRTRFGPAPMASAAPASPLLRQDEQALITRFQLSY